MSDKYPTAGLKPCPFCGQDVHPDYDFPQYVIHQTNKNGFSHSRLFMNRNDWNIRPIEDRLKARIAELEAQVKSLLPYSEGYSPDERLPKQLKQYPPVSVDVLGEFEFEESDEVCTVWSICWYCFDIQEWGAGMDLDVTGLTLVRWYPLPNPPEVS